jgi:hypothetical protein
MLNIGILIIAGYSFGAATAVKVVQDPYMYR